MRLILALNSLLQIEQERSEKESSVGDALALAFRCARFCSASLILFASYSPASLFYEASPHNTFSRKDDNLYFKELSAETFSQYAKF